VKLAEMGDDRLKCTKEQLADALAGSPEAGHRQLLKLHMERLKLLDEQIDPTQPDERHRAEEASGCGSAVG
jgi:hypothetical protein